MADQTATAEQAEEGRGPESETATEDAGQAPAPSDPSAETAEPEAQPDQEDDEKQKSAGLAAAIAAATKPLRDEAVKWRKKYSATKTELDTLRQQLADAKADALAATEQLQTARLEGTLRSAISAAGIRGQKAQSRLLKAIDGEFEVAWEDGKPKGNWEEAIKAAIEDLGLAGKSDGGTTVHAPWIGSRPRNSASPDAPTGRNADIEQALARRGI